jgi:tetratricopeptide (TPR) repeat protein
MTKAAQAYESLLVVRPTHYAALNNLALIYAQKRDFARAEALLRRSIESNPSALTAYGNLMTYQAEQGKTAAMESTYAAQLRVSSNNPRIALARINMLFARGDYDGSDFVIDSLAKANPTATDLARQRSSVHQVTAMARGKMNESLRLGSENATASAARGEPGALLSASFDSAMVEAWYRGNKEKAIAIVQAGLKRTPLETLKPLDRPYIGLAQVYALAGRADLARAMLAQFETTTPTMSAEDATAARHSILSAIALAEHRYLDAAHEAQAADIGQCTTCATPVIAYAYDLADKPDSALALYTRYVNSKSILNRFGNDAFFRAGSLKRLGELYEAKGDRSNAVRYYTEFVAMWKDADADLQPRVAEVKRKLARLGDAESR